MGATMPDRLLPATDGTQVNLRTLDGRSVVFCYPFTGRPGYANPPGWDDIAGAHGSTPQALGFAKHYDAFKRGNIRVFGLSFQSLSWQQDFVLRNALPYVLLSDENRAVSTELGLETFRAGQEAFLRRRCILIAAGRVVLDMYPVLDPETNAAELLKVLQP